jgi:hypothetical protein
MGSRPLASASRSPAGSTPSASGPTDEPLPTASDPADPGDGGLPTWVAPAAIAVLFAAAGGAAVVRRRRGTTGP